MIAALLLACALGASATTPILIKSTGVWLQYDWLYFYYDEGAAGCGRTSAYHIRK